MAANPRVAEQFTTAWQRCEGDELAHQVNHTLDTITERQRPRETNLLRYARLYGDLPILGFGAFSYNRVDAGLTLGRLSLNVVRNCSNAVTAKITKNKVRPMFLTNDGDYALMQKAKKLQQFTEGLFYDIGVYKTTPRCFQDCTVFGTGVVKIFREGNAVKVERVFLGELHVDDAEALYGAPRRMYQEKYVDRSVLLELYGDNPELRQAIADTTRAFDRDIAMQDTTSDLVRVREAWSLPSGPDAKDGKHAICIANATLFEEEWKYDYFPFAFLRWDMPLLGFWGVGLAEQLTGLQLEINKLLRQIQIAMHMGSTLKIFVNRASGVKLGHLNNDMVTIIEHNGQAPEFHVPQTVHPEVFAHLDRLYSRSYEITGISQLSAQSQKPAGLDSGKALETYNDIETERFIGIGHQWEDFHLEIARQAMAVAREIAEDEGTFKINYVGRSSIKALDLTEVDLEEDNYRMQAYPTAALSQTPAGKLRDISDLMKMQLIEPAEAKRMFLEIPDLAEYAERATASFDELMHQLCSMAEKDDALVPDPDINVKESLPVALAFKLMCARKGVPQNRVDNIQAYVDDLKDMAAGNMPAQPVNAGQETAPVAAPPPGSPGAPPGGPMAPPPGAPPPMSPEAMRQAA